MSLTRSITRALTQPLTRSMTDPGAGGGSPHSAAMASFAGGVKGFAAQLTDMSTLYQDSARTQKVTTFGHVIANITDLSGNGNHADQPTASQRADYQGGARFLAEDDFYVTPSIDLTGTNKVTVVIRLAPESNASNSMPLEFSADYFSNPGSFALFAPNSSTNMYDFQIKGTSAGVGRQMPGNVAPLTSTIIAEVDLSAVTLVGQIAIEIVPLNGATSTGGSAVAATTFGNYQVYIGRRGGTTLPFKGKILAIGIIGKALTTTEKNTWRDWANLDLSPTVYGAISDKVVVAKRGNDLYIRTKWTPTVDLVQRMAMQDGAAASAYMVNFMGARLIANTEKDAQAAFNVATGANILAAQADDATPCQYNGTFIGANHGADRLFRFPKTTHGKTVEDIGSVWTDGIGNRWVLMTIVDANLLEFISENQSTYPAWSFRPTISGTTMTHASGATHTATITASSGITQYQLYPAVNNATKQALVDGSTDIFAANDAIYVCNDLFKVVHNYSITNPADVVQFAKDRVGGATTPDYADNSIDTDTALTIDYTFTPNHACTVQHSVEALQNLTLNYIGFLQSVKLTNSGTDVLWAYVPRSLSVGGFDFKAQANMTGFASTISFTSATWEVPTNPPASQTFIVKNSGGTKQFSYTHGYTVDKTIGVPATRLTLTNEACRFASTGKAYMTGINGSGSAFPSGILPQGASYSVTGVRAFINNVQDWPHGPEAYWYRDGSDVVVVLDFDTTQSNITFTLPAWMNGKTASVIENSGTFTCHSATASNGIVVSQSGAAGRGIVRLS